MIPIALYEVCLPLPIGFLLVRALAPRIGMVLAACLGLGIGIGAVSCAYFISLFTGLPSVVLESALVLGILLFMWRAAPQSPQRVAAKPFTRLELGLGLAFVVFLGCGIRGWMLQWRVAPHGFWDAWAIWNLRARFLTTDYWRDGLSPVLYWSHPDYPLLLSGFVARMWRFTGGWDPGVSAVTSFLFTFGTVCLLVASLTLLKSRAYGFVAGIILLGTPYFITYGTAQLADIPLSFFILSTLALLALQDRFGPESSGLAVLAGLTAALAAWTKNEGLMLVAAVVLVRAIVLFRAGGKRMVIGQGRFFVLGMAPVLLLIAFFKHFAPPNPHIGTQSAATLLAMVTDKSRYAEVNQAFVKHFFSFGNLSVGVFLILAVWLACAGLDVKKNRAAAHTALGTLAAMLAGYYVVYLISPFGVAWLVATSLDRVLLQLWPAVIFTAFLCARVPVEAWPEPGPSPAARPDDAEAAPSLPATTATLS
jgi:hypothetical protein